MDLLLRDRAALVMGGSSGLGLGIATALAEAGACVCLLARDAGRLAAAAERLRQASGAGVGTLAVDLAEPEAVGAAIGDIVEGIGTPDILIGNGGGPPPGVATRFDPATMTLTDAFLPAMRERRFGRIIMVSSTSVVEPIPGLVLSNALRAALANWGRTLAREVARDGVTVNTLMPGRFDTARARALTEARAKDGLSVEDVRRRDIETIPAGRFGTPEEFGAVAAFLASPRAAYVTGALIPVDGGLLG
jgi:3-oxoacyl-[acyl-carrier protein] reductase